MLKKLKHAKNWFFNQKKEDNPTWFHTMRIKHCPSCPDRQPHCLVVWEDGKVMDKCIYAVVTENNPEAGVLTKRGLVIGVRCIPSNAIDFILKEI